MYTYFLLIRNFLIANFSVSIKTIEIDNKIIKNNILFYILKLVPFNFLKIVFNIFKIKYIYLMDNLYFSNYTEETKIMPLLIAFKTDTEIDLMDNIKKYNFNIPIWFFLLNENLNIDYFKIKYFNKGKMNNKDFLLNSNKNKLLADIFI